MRLIKELGRAIILKKESLRTVNEYSIKRVIIIFIITNIIFPFLFNSFYLLVKHNMNMSSVFTLSYFMMWNILINLVLFFSLWLIFFITNKSKSKLFFSAVVFMNLLQPLEIFLSYTIDNLLITIFFIVYDIFFVTEYIEVNLDKSNLSKKQMTLNVLSAFLMVLIFLSVTQNTYMLYSEKIF